MSCTDGQVKELVLGKGSEISPTFSSATSVTTSSHPEKSESAHVACQESLVGFSWAEDVEQEEASRLLAHIRRYQPL